MLHDIRSLFLIYPSKPSILLICVIWCYMNMTKRMNHKGMIVSIHCLAYKVQFMVSGGNCASGEDNKSQS